MDAKGKPKEGGKSVQVARLQPKCFEKGSVIIDPKAKADRRDPPLSGAFLKMGLSFPRVPFQVGCKDMQEEQDHFAGVPLFQQVPTLQGFLYMNAINTSIFAFGTKLSLRSFLTNL